MILENKIRCKKCGDIIVSEHRHDYKSCKCGACAVDGGFTYRRIIGNQEDWEDLAVIKEFGWEKARENIMDVLFKNYGEKEITVKREDLQKVLSALDDYSLATVRYSWMLKNGKTFEDYNRR